MYGLTQEYGGAVSVIYYDIDNSANRGVVSHYGAYSIPLTVVLDSNGQTASQWRGVTSASRLRGAIEQVLYQ